MPLAVAQARMPLLVRVERAGPRAAVLGDANRLRFRRHGSRGLDGVAAGQKQDRTNAPRGGDQSMTPIRHVGTSPVRASTIPENMTVRRLHGYARVSAVTNHAPSRS